MTQTDLVSFIDTFIDVLQKNQAAVTPQTLADVKTLLECIEVHQDVLARIFQVNPAAMANTFILIDKLLAVEEKMIAGLNVRIINALTGLKARPLILTMLASFIS